METNEIKSSCGCGANCQCGSCSGCSFCKSAPLILVALLLMTVGLGIFFLRQATALRKQVEQSQKFVAEYNQNVAGPGTRLIGNLQAFAKSNPDLAPILAKYQLGGVKLDSAPKK
ncbi:MAG: hypothetical protein RLZZ350_976 [Verrucomicrobiota bacterium]|jgi:hypothetical protein